MSDRQSPDPLDFDFGPMLARLRERWEEAHPGQPMPNPEVHLVDDFDLDSHTVKVVASLPEPLASLEDGPDPWEGHSVHCNIRLIGMEAACNCSRNYAQGGYVRPVSWQREAMAHYRSMPETDPATWRAMAEALAKPFPPEPKSYPWVLIGALGVLALAGAAYWIFG